MSSLGKKYITSSQTPAFELEYWLQKQRQVKFSYINKQTRIKEIEKDIEKSKKKYKNERSIQSYIYNKTLVRR